MQTYTTQMDAARKGIITPQMEIVAKKEYRTPEEIRQLVAEGKVAIPANKHHECLDPEGIGSMLRTKINVNLGVSRDCKDYNIEMKKVMSAVNMGAEAIMDLSSHGNTQPFRQKLTHECPVMIGTVPVYDSVIHYQRDLAVDFGGNDGESLRWGHSDPTARGAEQRHDGRSGTPMRGLYRRRGPDAGKRAAPILDSLGRPLYLQHR